MRKKQKIRENILGKWIKISISIAMGFEFCEARYNTFVMFRIVYIEEVRPERI